MLILCVVYNIFNPLKSNAESGIMPIDIVAEDGYTQVNNSVNIEREGDDYLISFTIYSSKRTT